MLHPLPLSRAAKVGIAIASLDSAVAGAADVIITEPNLMLIAELIKVSRRTMAIIHQNLALAIAVMVISALPALAGYIPLWLAVLLHEGSTLLAVLNGLRLFL